MKGQASLEALVSFAAFLAFILLLLASFSSFTQKLSSQHSFLEAKAQAIRYSAVSDAFSPFAFSSYSASLGNCTAQAVCSVKGETASAKSLGALNGSFQFV